MVSVVATRPKPAVALEEKPPGECGEACCIEIISGCEGRRDVWIITANIEWFIAHRLSHHSEHDF